MEFQHVSFELAGNKCPWCGCPVIAQDTATRSHCRDCGYTEDPTDEDVDGLFLDWEDGK